MKKTSSFFSGADSILLLTERLESSGWLFLKVEVSQESQTNRGHRGNSAYEFPIRSLCRDSVEGRKVRGYDFGQLEA